MDDKSPQHEAPATADPLRPGRRSVHRRLVQSTLFPHKPLEAEAYGDQKGDRNSGEEDDEGDDECTGSQKKKRKRKGKTTPQSRTPKKKVKDKEPASTTPKRNTTPKKKNVKTNGLNGVCASQILTEDVSPPPIPNLRLEAKIIAEENSRMFAGKQVHPFFSSWKMGKKQKDVIDVENWCSSEKKDGKITIGPIHVFEKDQDDDVCLDWRNWTFYEETSVNSSYDLEGMFLSSGFEGFVESLNFDKLPSTSQPCGTSFHQNKVSLDPCLVQQEHLLEALPKVSSVAADEQTIYQRIKDATVDLEVGFLPEADGPVSKSDLEQHRFLQERRISYELGCRNDPEDSLWIDKYQPKRVVEVCGNAESVKLLSEWLHCWHERDSQASEELTGNVKHNMRDNDYNYYQNDTDSENSNEGASLKNVLLVTGPAGSGKSAAIYACAKEQGFKVLESNASQWRSGADLKHEFEESLRSNMLNWSVKNPVDLCRKQNMKNFPALPNGVAGQEFDNEVVELIPIPDEEDPQDVTRTSGEFACKESGTACCRGDTKLLLLIEDVDVILPEDRGFIAAIQHIAEAAKGPIILTSNNDSPILPERLDRLEVFFSMPSAKELFCHLYMICTAEKAEIQPQLIEQLIAFHHSDIRKTIMHLQFWCHGKVNGKDRGALTTCSPLLFDLDAGHQILPKIIPWDFPSQLSELVEKEISKTLSMLEENFTSVEEEKNSNEEMQNDLERHNNAIESIEAKQEAMLYRNCYADDCNEIRARYDATCEFPTSSGSPVAFSRRKVRRKLDVVMSSDSEDEFITDRNPVVPDNDTNQELILKVESGFPSHCPTLENCVNQLADKHHDSQVEKLENLYQVSETANYVCINNSSKLVDVSCVPESSFVPETEMDNEKELLSRTVSCGHVDDAAEVSVSSELIHISSPVKAESFDKIHRFDNNSYMLEDNCTEIAESSHEDPEDSQTEQLEAVARGYHLMDECSRMDFNRDTKIMKKCRSSGVPDLVQESWKKFRGCRADLRQYVASEKEDAFQILELACGMSNLISEGDLLFSSCQRFASASFEASIIPSEEFDAFGWQDEQLQMTSSFAQHGFCIYGKDVAAVVSNMSSQSRMNLPSETLASLTDIPMAGIFLGQDKGASSTSHPASDFGMSPLKSDISSESLLCSERKSCLFDAVLPMVPSKSYLALKGAAFHEYISSLGHISRSESSRLSESIDKTRKRRRRGARHYLSTGRLMLSDEDISLLARCSLYGKGSSQLKDGL